MTILNKIMMYVRVLKEYVRKTYVQCYVFLVNHTPKKGNPVFSVIVPVYDRTDVVREAIESVLDQSFKNFELILICDGSPSETLEVVTDYENHPQVRIFQFPDSSGNACRGRNHGIRNAKGRYIAFLDSDDLASPNRLKSSLFHLVYRRVDLVGGAYECIVEPGNGRGVPDGQIGYSGETCTYESFLEKNLLGICTVAVKRSFLHSFGGFREEMRYREDHELWLRLVRNGCVIYNSPEVFAKYRIHSDNAEKRYLENDAHWLSQALIMHKREYIWLS